MRTYTNLLKDPFDEELFAHYARAQLTIIDSLTGSERTVGEAGLLKRARPSPDGKHFLVERMQRPFSYLLPYRSFAQYPRLGTGIPCLAQSFPRPRPDIPNCGPSLQAGVVQTFSYSSWRDRRMGS